MMGRTLKELAAETDPERIRRAGSLRRLAISFTAKPIWQLIGFKTPDGSVETMSSEPFTGIGVFARPPDGSKSEAIAAMIGDAGAPVIIAVRDEATRAKSAGDLKADETALYNSLARVHVRADGVIELAPVSGGLVEAMIKGQTYRAAEDTLFTALGVFVTAIGALNPATASIAATTFNNALTAFHAAAATYLSTVGKVG